VIADIVNHFLFHRHKTVLYTYTYTNENSVIIPSHPIQPCQRSFFALAMETEIALGKGSDI